MKSKYGLLSRDQVEAAIKFCFNLGADDSAPKLRRHIDTLESIIQEYEMTGREIEKIVSALSLELDQRREDSQMIKYLQYVVDQVTGDPSKDEVSVCFKRSKPVRSQMASGMSKTPEFKP